MLVGFVSIVAVTGLSGNAYGSWKNRANNYMWLQHSLPQDLQQRALVMVYGYNTTLNGPTFRTDNLDGLVEEFVLQLQKIRAKVKVLGLRLFVLEAKVTRIWYRIEGRYFSLGTAWAESW